MSPNGHPRAQPCLPRLAAMGWAVLAWLALAAVELAPAVLNWDTVTMQQSRVSVQHIACSAALGAWVGLHGLWVRQQMARAPAAGPEWSTVLISLAVAVVPFTALTLALPAVSTGLASLRHAHSHSAGPLAPTELHIAGVILLWTLGAGWWWVRAFPTRIGLGGPLLLAGGWLLSPHSSGLALGCAAGLAWLAALLWPAHGASTS